MAIKHVNTIKDFWPKYWKKVVLGTIGMEILLAAVVMAAVFTAIGVPDDTVALILFTIALVVGAISVNLILVHLVTTPLKHLTSAITHSAGELSTVTPPSPNAKRYQSNGFKPILQYIYETTASKSGALPSPAAQGDMSNLRQALDQTSAGLAILTPEGELTYANKRTPITITTANTKQLELVWEDNDTLQQWLDSVKDKEVNAEKTWLRVPNKITGEEGRRIFDITASFSKGSAAEVVLVLFDQTGLYQPEDDGLDFIAFAAHELRGPITVIRGYLDVLGVETEGVLQPDQQELIKRLVVSANRLSGYINNILNASRYDRRHLQLHLTEDTIPAIFDTINDDLQLRASSQNRLLSVSLPADLPTIAADRSSLSEVMTNLIDNAIKYSNEGGVVNVTAAAEGDFVKFNVEDHGIGMPASVIGNLFHKFYRSHRSRETVAGTGIGLYISKAIVESHGGKIGLQSAEDKGSTFWFMVPTYASVKDKLLAGGNVNSEAGMITSGGSWIKNHSTYSG